VGEDQSQMRMALEQPRVDRVDHRSRGVHGKLEHRAGSPARHRREAGRLDRMHEHGGGPPVEFGEHRLEHRVAEVAAGIVGGDDEPVGVQLVQGACELGDGAVGLAHRQAGQEAEAVGTPRNEVGADVVAPLDLVGGACRRIGQQLELDPVAVHEPDRLLGAPRRGRRGEEVPGPQRIRQRLPREAGREERVVRMYVDQAATQRSRQPVGHRFAPCRNDAGAPEGPENVSEEGWSKTGTRSEAAARQLQRTTFPAPCRGSRGRISLRR
jgi:hypothetical protein